MYLRLKRTFPLSNIAICDKMISEIEYKIGLAIMVQEQNKLTNEMNTDWLSVCKRLKIYRNSLGLNQAKFAAKIGKAQSYYSNIEQGKLRPSSEILLSIAKLGCDMNWLLSGNIDEAKVETYVSHGFTMLSIINLIEKLDDDVKEFIQEVIAAYLKSQKHKVYAEDEGDI